MATNFEFPWENAAMNESEMPDGLDLPDQLAFSAMRNIYAAYHRKILNREMAAAEKLKVRRTYEMNRSALEQNKKLAAHYSSIIRKAEMAATACRKDPTPENTLHLCNVLDGLA